MPTTDTDLQQLVINVGTTAQIEAAISGGTITQDMLSITTDGDTYLTTGDIDNKSITENSSDELQTVGVIDQNNTSNAIKTWTGTLAQYNAITTKDANTLYNITDDTVPTDVGVDVVVDYQLPTSNNNYIWYRKYKSGWVEQGGIATIPSKSGGGASDVSITFPVTMQNTYYTGLVAYLSGGAYFAETELSFYSKTTTGTKIQAYCTNYSATTDDFLVGWEVKGMATS